MTRLSTMTLTLCIAGMLTLTALAPSRVEAQVSEDRYRETTAINQMFEKLGRGLANVLLGWVEIPKQVAQEWRRTEPFTGTIVGIPKGIVWGVARTLAGFYEVVSFPFPVPRDYKPIIYPEFVLPTVWGERLPIYRDEFLAGDGLEQPVLDYGTNEPTYGRPESRSLERQSVSVEY